MNIEERKTIDQLTVESVSILTTKHINVDGVESQVGENHRCTYVNSTAGRKDLLKKEPEAVINAVFAIWGDTPTVEEPDKLEVVG